MKYRAFRIFVPPPPKKKKEEHLKRTFEFSESAGFRCKNHSFSMKVRGSFYLRYRRHLERQQITETCSKKKKIMLRGLIWAAVLNRNASESYWLLIMKKTSSSELTESWPRSIAVAPRDLNPDWISNPKIHYSLAHSRVCKSPLKPEM